eukprot:2075061-Lingulodinium_polyedra.AAC.1
MPPRALPAFAACATSSVMLNSPTTTQNERSTGRMKSPILPHNAALLVTAACPPSSAARADNPNRAH